MSPSESTVLFIVITAVMLGWALIDGWDHGSPPDPGSSSGSSFGGEADDDDTGDGDGGDA